MLIFRANRSITKAVLDRWEWGPRLAPRVIRLGFKASFTPTYVLVHY